MRHDPAAARRRHRSGIAAGGGDAARCGFGTPVAWDCATAAPLRHGHADSALPALPTWQNHQQDQDDAHSSSPGLCNGEQRR
jgi:hypothetical protein